MITPVSRANATGYLTGTASLTVSSNNLIQSQQMRACTYESTKTLQAIKDQLDNLVDAITEERERREAPSRCLVPNKSTWQEIFELFEV